MRSQEKAAKAYANGKIQADLVPISVRRTNAEAGETGWGLATADEPMRPGTTLENLAGLKTPFRPHGRVTAGNAAGLNDGATASMIASEDFARELDLPVKMRLVAFAFAGVEPEVMGYRPDPGHREGAGQGGSDDRRHRPVRGQRGVRRAGARASSTTTASPTTTRASTSTAAPSPSATRWPPPASV